MLAVKQPIAIVPGAIDMSLGPPSDPRDVVHLTVALPHVHEGRPASSYYTVVQP